MIKEKAKDVVGETVVDGVKNRIKQDIQENWKEYALAAAGVNLLFSIINRPRAHRSDVHFYIHIV